MQVNLGWAYNDPNNNKYYLTIAASITQMLLHSNPDNFYNIYIITDRNDDFDIIKYLYKGNNYKITKSEAKGIELLGEFNKISVKLDKWSNAMYWKQLFPFTFPEIDKIIVCDGDILFNGDIAKVWEEVNVDDYHEIGHRNIRAELLSKINNDEFWVNEYKSMINDRGDYEQIKDKTCNWVNMGFFISNLKKIREDKCYEDWPKSLKYLNSLPNYPYTDEEMIYLSEKTRVGFLDWKYNCHVYNTWACFQYYYLLKDINKLKDLCQNALTFHYMNPKPWTYSDQLNSPGTFKRNMLGITIDFTIYNHHVFKEYKDVYDKLSLYSTL